MKQPVLSLYWPESIFSVLFRKQVIKQFEHIPGFLQALFRRLGNPFSAFCLILLSSVPCQVKQPQPKLGSRNVLFRRFPVPFHSFTVILLHACTFQVHPRQMILGV